MLSQLVRGCSAEGLDSDVVTLDSASDSWLCAQPGPVHALGPSMGRYRYCPSLVPWLEGHCRDYDAVVVHGIWQFQGAAVRSVCRRLGRPYFVFVHGALDPWFKRRYPVKHLKKLLYWLLVEHRVLRDAAAVLFTCDEERRLAAESFWPFTCRAEIVPLGISEPPGDPDDQSRAFLRTHGQLSGTRILLFLSRIHPKKGCDLLLEAFASVCTRDERLHLVMAGPDEVGWGESLARLADSLGIAARITWTGMLTGEEKWSAYREADAFVLPSHSENFGVVVAEALACGLPVLISNRVNIWREVLEAGAGFVEHDTLQGTRALLESWLQQTEPEAKSMRQRARACYESNFEADAACRSFMKSVTGTLAERNAAVAGRGPRWRGWGPLGDGRLAKLRGLLLDRQYRWALLRHGVAAGVEHEPVLRGLACRTVIDIGANRGQFALCARRCFPEAEIVSLEPLPEAAQRFVRVFHGDPRVTLHQAAIGPFSGPATMHVSRKADSSSLLPISEAQVRAFPGTEEARTRSVRVGRLTEFVNEHAIGVPALLKLDVQGYELSALRGCDDLLREFEWIYVECSYQEFYEGQVLADDLFAWLRSRGYALVGFHGQVVDHSGAVLQADALFRRVSQQASA